MNATTALTSVLGGLVFLYAVALAISLVLAWLYAFVIGWGWTAGSLFARNRKRSQRDPEPVDMSAYEELPPLG